ncbi:MAG TPA: HEPN domain-containing protein, partial [Firmicutes bacterium]|nr:HEPN domain-containing protein [Bacillota bacterium]
GLYVKRLNEMPPRVHNLVYLLDRAKVGMDESVSKFLIRINESSVATRYPENLARMEEVFSRAVVGEILEKAEEALQWIEKQY